MARGVLLPSFVSLAGVLVVLAPLEELSVMSLGGLLLVGAASLGLSYLKPVNLVSMMKSR